MSRKGDLDVGAMFRSEWTATGAKEKRVAAVAAAPLETASMYVWAREWFSNQGSTKPFLSLMVLNLAWDRSVSLVILSEHDIGSKQPHPWRSNRLCTFARQRPKHPY